MADTVEITAGSGTTIGTDEVTIGGTLQHVQRMKLVDGTDGGAELIPGTAARGLFVDARASVVRVSQTPTISTTAYTAKDAMGALLTFANAARSAGAPTRLAAVQLVDNDQVRTDVDLVLFDRTITAPTDNAIFAPTDTEASYCVGVVPISSGLYADFSTVCVATVNNIGLDILPNGTDVFGVLVNRIAGTFAASNSLTVTATFVRL